ncbi:rCG44235 [Rattus norvegicus]|uniref:RCG44235 n=1 Tax=Rattus norvegicus TaxID=10116 RepID=A6J723_RAT|nr:rCG44235 [Rattus norvegicus]
MFVVEITSVKLHNSLCYCFLC